MIQLLNRILSKNGTKEFIKYGIVGVIGLIIDMGIYYLLVKKFEVHYPFSNNIQEILGLSMTIRMLDILISNIMRNNLS